MSYFRHFSKVPYVFGDQRSEAVEFTNLSSYVDILDQVQDQSTIYRFYQVRDGERPDTVSFNLYGTTEHYWTFFLLNQNLREIGWPLSQRELFKVAERDVPGECLVFFGSDTNSETGATQHEIVGKFPVGTTINGTISGAAGIVYAKNPLLGQIFVKKTNSIPFQANETVIDTIGTGSNFNLVCRIVHNPAYTAIRSVEDGEGRNVDVDFSADFRGRPPETAGDIPGGVFDDAENPDIFADSSPYKRVSFLEHYENVNTRQSRIRVLKRDVVDQISRLYRRALENA